MNLPWSGLRLFGFSSQVRSPRPKRSLSGQSPRPADSAVTGPAQNFVTLAAGGARCARTAAPGVARLLAIECATLGVGAKALVEVDRSTGHRHPGRGKPACVLIDDHGLFVRNETYTDGFKAFAFSYISEVERVGPYDRLREFDIVNAAPFDNVPRQKNFHLAALTLARKHSGHRHL